MCRDVQAMLLRQLLLETQVSSSLSLSPSARNHPSLLHRMYTFVPCALCKDGWWSSAVGPWPSIAREAKPFLMLLIQQKDEGQHQQSIPF